jgi:uncharacterized protein YecT (DUF1311 family)
MNLTTSVFAQAKPLVILAFLLSVGLIFGVRAATEEVSFDLAACRAEATTTLAYNYCASRAEEVADELLNQYLEKAYEQRGSETAKSKIFRSQVFWEAYRASHCQAAEGEGSISAMMYHQCRARVTNARTLEVWESFLWGIGGSGNSVLPKPVFDTQ